MQLVARMTYHIFMRLYYESKIDKFKASEIILLFLMIIMSRLSKNKLERIFMCKNVLIVLILLYSCGDSQIYNKPSFPIEKDIKCRVLSDELMIVGLPNDFFVDSNYVYILALANNKWLHIYDKHSGEFVESVVHQGRGHGEINRPESLNFWEKNRQVCFYDNSSAKLYYYQLTDPKEGFIKYVKTEDFSGQGAIRGVWSLHEKRFLVDGQIEPKPTSEMKRFQLLDSSEIVSEYNTFPVDGDDRLAVIGQKNITFSPDRTKFVLTIIYGGILEIFDIQEDSIQQKVLRMFYPPNIMFKDGSVLNTSETVFGFSSSTATSQRIYTVSIDSTDPNQFNKISIFDWQGNELVRYNTDCLVYRIFVREDEPNTIYGIMCSKTNGFNIVSFDLNEVSEQVSQEIQLSVQEKEAVIKSAKKVKDSTVRTFNSLFNEWTKEIRTNPLMQLSSNTFDYAKCPQFEQLKSMCTEIIPLIVDKMLDRDKFFSLVLYDAIQNNDELKVSRKFCGSEQDRAKRTIRVWLNSQTNQN